MCAPPPPFPQYQGGSSFSVFTAQGSNPAFNCKISGKFVHKVYDKTVKGYVYNCLGGMLSKIQFPKEEKTGLQLVQPYLVLQIFVPKGQHFSLELRAADTQGTRRKMYFSTSFSELKTNPLHCQIPLSMIMRNTWISLALDVPDLFRSCFRVLNFRSLDVIILSPICKLRKIFTMRSRLAQSVLEAKDDEECLPLEHTFAAGVEATIQVIDTQKIKNLLGIASSVEGKEGTVTPPVFSAQKKYLNRIDRHVNVAFGSRMPLPVSTVRINTNLPHDVNGLVTYNPQASHLTNATETQATVETLKVSEPKACLPQTRIFSSGTEKPPRLKALNPNAFNNIVPQHSWDSLSFPVQEEPHVDNIETDPVVIDKCLDLTSKHGQKLQKFNRRKEVKIRKRHQFVRHSQKENCSQSKLREPKESDVKESPPGSPPSGWDNNSNGGSDSFLFEQHFEELPECTSRGTLPHCYTIAHSFGDTCNHNQDSQTFSENGCIMGEGDSYFEKKISCAGKGGLPALMHWQDQSRVREPLNNIIANEKNCSHEIQKACSYRQELGSQAFESHFVGSDDGSRSEVTKPDKHVLTSKMQETGGLLQQNGPFGSTEELWIVHEEGDYGDPASYMRSNGLSDRGLELEGSSTRDIEDLQSFNGPFITDTTTNLTSTTQSSSLCIKNSSMEGPASTRLPESNIHCVQTKILTRNGNQMKPGNLESRKPLPSKLEDKELDLLYDPILDCYYDPKTNRYYELK